MNRCSGILMPVFSLPSPYGIGTLGKAAYDFADFLHAAGQRCWQMLPLGPTSYGDSPYQSFSTYAGNPYFIDLELLIEDGLLTRDEVESQNWGTNPRYVDYGKIYESRFAVLQKAKDRGWVRDREAVAAFQAENSRWLPDYALYMACKRHFGMRSWTEWEDADIRLRKSPEVLERYRTLLREDVELFTYLQFLFFRQWNRLRDYLHGLDIQDHRRPAHLCGHGFRRRVGGAGELPAGRPVRAHGGIRRAAGLFQRRRSAVGQSPVRLGPDAGRRLRLVDPPGGRGLQAV